MSDTKTTPTLDVILLIILFVKIVWIISIFSHFITKEFFHDNYEEMLTVIEEWSHNLFTLLIGILLIYLYNHLTTSKVCIDGHAKMYLYSFGILSGLGVIQKSFHKYYFSKDIDTM